MYLYAVNRVVVEAMESFILLRITLLESLCAFFWRWQRRRIGQYLAQMLMLI